MKTIRRNFLLVENQLHSDTGKDATKDITEDPERMSNERTRNTGYHRKHQGLVVDP